MIFIPDFPQFANVGERRMLVAALLGWYGSSSTVGGSRPLVLNPLLNRNFPYQLACVVSGPLSR